jgi:hypothetical protein
MKNDLTTGAWQHDIGCTISIIFLSTSDVPLDDATPWGHVVGGRCVIRWGGAINKCGFLREGGGIEMGGAVSICGVVDRGDAVDRGGAVKMGGAIETGGAVNIGSVINPS